MTEFTMKAFGKKLCDVDFTPYVMIVSGAIAFAIAGTAGSMAGLPDLDAWHWIGSGACGMLVAMIVGYFGKGFFGKQPAKG